ncbi:hypothetical protein B0T26DRAFT_717849 [Lasiosphaeria miniovina]|uniref:Uncharacterized protein n=1 Tax=Lasiosphaeria miniovina TaxID=1954250 RepID=A0AA40AD22_9PEZI|nr:uncharacterized protein B0T26DRAFT_717849 [Lasiosphaeria miniovina]KAK0713580.1 hypothetical protein B0T26DRAFT_717849 [Lasiosphaeria miniovina]
MPVSCCLFFLYPDAYSFLPGLVMSSSYMHGARAFTHHLFLSTCNCAPFSLRIKAQCMGTLLLSSCFANALDIFSPLMKHVFY